MTVTTVETNGRQVQVDLVAPDALLSTDNYVAIAPIDARPWRSIAYTIAVITNDLKWTVYGANASDYSDEQEVQAEAVVAAAATGTYTVAQAPYAYYRAKIKANVGGSQGTATVRGIAKG